MYFDYDGYVLGCLTLPIQQLIFAVFAIVLIILCKSWANLPRGATVLSIIAGLGIGVFACMYIGQLRHGGIYLYREIEADAVQMQGYITEIDELGIYSFPIIECDYYENPKYGDPNGYEFTINGILCTAPTNGSLKVGDYVEVEYLPKSGYILYIDKLEE